MPLIGVIPLPMPVALTVVHNVTCNLLSRCANQMLVTVAAFVFIVFETDRFELHPTSNNFLVPYLELALQYGWKGIQPLRREI